MTATAPATFAARFAARVTSPLPARDGEPRTVVAGPASRLVALAGQPLAAAAEAVRSADLACQDATEVLEEIDADLHEAFQYALTQLDLAARMVTDTTVVDSATFPTGAAPFPFEPRTPLGAGELDVPVALSTEGVYGLREELRGALTSLASSVRTLGSAPRRGVPSAAIVPWLSEVALAASRVERVADVVVAHNHARLHPATPQLPGVGGDVELYPAGRAAPLRRWALRSRVRFTPGRVEIVSSRGRLSVGQTSAIGSLLWVAPGLPTAVEVAHEPEEAWTDRPELDGLGTVHVLDTTGRSLASLAVADWASQPTTVVDQVLVDSTVGDLPLGAARGVWALETLGFARGAATIGVPLIRGVAHPPPADDGIGLVRAGAERLPYRGRDLTPKRVLARRSRRRRAATLDLGPGFAISGWIRPFAPVLAALAPLIIWPLGGRSPFQLAVVVLTVAVLAEPWAVWAAALVRDLVPRLARLAVYSPGGPGRPRIEATSRLLLVRSASGHHTWIPGPQDADLGVTRLVRLQHDGRTWGFALADARDRWRLVLPAAEWAPERRYEDLETFARTARLELAEQEAPPLPRLGADSVSRGSSGARARGFGPRPRALVILGATATPATLLSLLGPQRSLWLGLVILALTYGGAVLVTWLTRRRLGRNRP